jgi:hypothetical protein
MPRCSICNLTFSSLDTPLKHESIGDNSYCLTRWKDRNNTIEAQMLYGATLLWTVGVILYHIIYKLIT